MEAGEGLTKTFNIPISHLDFEYVEKCTDIKELEKIYFTLKVGEEGKYPQLESFCEERLKKLNPESRVLRKPTPLKTIDQLEREQRDLLTQDFELWLSEMQNQEEMVSKLNPSEKGDCSHVHNFPIRNKQPMMVSENKQHSEKKATPKSCKPKDYNEWSKIADQLEKQMIMEEKEEEPKKPDNKSKTEVEKTKSKTFQNLSNKIDTGNMSESEKERLAVSEKEKGNEAFRAGDLEEADVYYCRSLSIQPNLFVYNNRGLIHMKRKKWEDAIRDFNTVIKGEPSNVKALLRRGTCYSEIHNLQDAITDCQKVLKLSPNNKSADALLIKSQEELQKRAQPKLKDGRRMIITEVGSDEESSDNEDLNDRKVSEQSEMANDANEVKENVVAEHSDVSPHDDLSEAVFLKLKDEGNELFKELKYEEALEIYSKLVNKWPSNPVGFRNRAACNLMLERPQDVIDDCTIAIGLDKNSHLSFYRRGKAYKLLKRYDESLEDLGEALRIAPNHRQITDELNDVKALLHEHKSSAETEADGVKKIRELHMSMMMSSEAVDEASVEEVQRSSPVSGTWELVDDAECAQTQDEQDAGIVIVDGDAETRSTVPLQLPSAVDTVQPSNSEAITKVEFDKKLGFLKSKGDWRATIQLLVDASPSRLVALMGSKLDGFILEHIVSSLVVYSANDGHAGFIRSVLAELAKVQRFCFVKMMVSDQAILELERLFTYLRRVGGNLAELDGLQLTYQ